MNIKDVIAFLDEKQIGYRFEGKANLEIMGYSSIFHYRPDTISWLRDVLTIEKEDSLKRSIFTCLITEDGTKRIEQAQSQLWVENPKDTFFDILDYFWGEKYSCGISEAAIIEDGATIGSNVVIGPFSHISSKTVIGDNCRIGSNVTIKGKVLIGNDCVIQSGAVIGEDGFAYIRHGDMLKFVKHYGGVTLENHVHIGSQTCVCRGAIDDTHIGEYTKIDNLCHIAHNVEIGKRCLVIAGAVVMGSVHIGDDCWVATSMIRDLRRVGNNSTVGMGAVVVKDVPTGITVAGNPAKVFEKK